jgi:hypothetical protein
MARHSQRQPHPIFKIARIFFAGSVFPELFFYTTLQAQSPEIMLGSQLHI